MPTPTTITNATVTINGKANALAGMLTLAVGQSVDFAAALAGGGTLVVNAYGDKAPLRNVSYPGKPWVVAAADAALTTLQLEHRLHGGQASKLEYPLRVTAASLAWGFAANNADDFTAFQRCLGATANAGGKWLRLWISNWGKIDDRTEAMIRQANAAGVSVILCVQPKDSDTQREDFGTPDFAKWVAVNAAVLKLVAYVEAGNELNLLKYRPDDFGSDWYQVYVDRWLKPLSQALASINVPVLISSVTESEHPERYAQHAAGFAKAGAAKWAKGVALHLYFYADGKANVSTIGMAGSTIDTVSDLLGLPVFVTEANPHKTVGSGDDYLAVLPQYGKQLRRAKVVIWYRGLPSGTPGNARSQRPLCDAAGKPTSVLAACAKAVA